MVAERKTIAVASGGEAARLLKEADDAPVILVLEGTTYRVEREPAGRTDEPSSEPNTGEYRSDAGLESMRAAFGSWRDLDTEQMKADIRRWRDEGSRPFDDEQ